MAWDSTDDAGKVVYWALVSAAEQEATGCIIVPDEYFAIFDMNRVVPGCCAARTSMASPPALQ